MIVFANIPPELQALPRWVNWRNEAGRKIPYDPKLTNGRASSTDPETWSTFEQARTAYEEREGDTDAFTGVGFVLNGDGLVGVDIDHCDTDPAALQLLDELGAAYVEVSPSGAGLRAFGYAEGLTAGCKGTYNGQSVELYSTGRYLTVTGHTLKQGPLQPLNGFAELAQAIRADRTVNPDTGEFTEAAPDARHAELVRRILSGEVYHDSLRDLAASLVATGMNPGAVVSHLRGLMDASVGQHDKRWKARREQIPSLVSSAGAKFAPQDLPDWFKPGAAASPEPGPQAQAKPERDPIDPFVDHPAPPFPLEVLPDVFREYAEACSRGSGFDAGAYGFSLMVMGAGLIDHRVKMQAGPMRVPPHLWGSLSADSGGGKSPVIDAASFAVHDIHNRILRDTSMAFAKWLSQPSGEEKGPAPDIRQMVLDNTTTEAAAKALNNNPEGLILVLPELSEWVGRMDAYSAGGDKDRGAWIRAFDGGPVSINRAKDSVPMQLDNFSAGMLAGIQPEKLAQMFAKSAAGGADGLFQRFLTYQMATPGEVDYSAEMPMLAKVNVTQIFQRLYDWREAGTIKDCRLSPEAQQAAQDHHNNLRTLGKRTPGGRFAEHIDKLPGLTMRVAFALHVIHAAAGLDDPLTIVPLGALERAQAVMRVLYRHSEAAYEHLDKTGIGAALKLARAACEAILAKGWREFQRGDLTRDATGWAGTDERAAEAAIDLLIDWAWLADVTPPTTPGKRGRRSMGRFEVNPAVPLRFQPHAERIAKERAERFQAIKKLGASRAEATAD
jgi:hypothetical protein